MLPPSEREREREIGSLQWVGLTMTLDFDLAIFLASFASSI